jgi:hypothetical protein
MKRLMDTETRNSTEHPAPSTQHPAPAPLPDGFLRRHGLCDYRRGAPGGIMGGAAEIDRPIAEEECPRCATPRQYHPFVRTGYGERGSYRAFSVCPHCGLEEEF